MIANPWWAPTKVFSLPICMRLYRNRQGLTKGNKKSAKRPTSSQKKAASKKAKQAAAAKKKAAANGWFVYDSRVYLATCGWTIVRYYASFMPEEGADVHNLFADKELQAVAADWRPPFTEGWQDD